MKKRLLAFLLVISLLTSIFPVFAQDELAVHISYDTISSSDDTVKLVVSWENNPGVAAVEWTFEYDSANLDLIKIEPSEDFDDFVCNAETGKVVLAKAKNTTKNGSLLYLTFKLAEGGLNGDYPITIESEVLGNADEEDIVASFYEGYVIVDVEGGIGVSDVTPDYNLPFTEYQLFTYPYEPTLQVSFKTPAEKDEGTSLTYQWYELESDSDEAEGTPLEGQTSTVLDVPLEPGETGYYYCEATNIYGGKSYTGRTPCSEIVYAKGKLYNAKLILDPVELVYTGIPQKPSTFTVLYRDPGKDETITLTENVDYRINCSTQINAISDTDWVLDENNGSGKGYTALVLPGTNGYYEQMTSAKWRIKPANIITSGSGAMTVYNNDNSVQIDETIISAASVDNKDLSAAYAVKSGEGSELITVDAEGNVKSTKVGTGTAYVTVTFSDPNGNHYDKSVDITVTVSDKEETEVTFTAKDAPITVFDGTGRYLSDFVNEATVEVEGTNPSMTYSVTYTPVDGESVTTDNVEPTDFWVYDAGTYSVTANYEDDMYTGSATVSFTIDQAVITVSGYEWNYEVPFSYDGYEKNVELNAEDEKLAITYSNASATKAGVYTASATAAVRADFANNYKVEGEIKTCEWEIKKAIIKLGELGWDYEAPFIYNGTYYEVKVTGVPEGVSVSYENNEKMAVGKYTATAEFAAADSNYQAEGEIDPLEWEIVKSKISVPSITTGVYDGTEKRGFEEHNRYTVAGNSAINAGEYTGTATLSDPDCYEWSLDENTDVYTKENDSTINVKWSIIKQPVSDQTGAVSLRYTNTAAQTITGDAIKALLNDTNPDTTITLKSISVNGDSILSASLADNVVTYQLNGGLTADNAGNSATISVSFESNNYEKSGNTSSDLTYTLTVTVIDKNDVSEVITFEDGSAEYTGTAQTYEAAMYNGAASANITYTYEPAEVKNVGSYTVTAIYEDSDNYGIKTATFTITPAPLTITGAEAEDKEFDGDTEATITAVTFGGLKGGDTLVLGEDYTVSNAQFASANIGEHGVTFTVTLNAQNYALANPSGSTTAQITAQPVEVTIDGISIQLYTGNPIEPAVTVRCNGEIVSASEYTVSYANNIYSTGNMSHAEPATVTVKSVGGNNRYFEKTGTFHILAADRTLESTATNETPASVVRGGTIDLLALVSTNTPDKSGITFDAEGYEIVDGKMTVGQELVLIPVNVKADFYYVNDDNKPEYNQAELTIYVQVVDKEDAGVTVSGVPAKVTYGDTFTLNAAAAKAGTNGKWIWESDNEDVITVENGKVTVLSVGTATITAKYESDTTYGAAPVVITADKAVVTITALDKMITVGNDLPELDADDYSVVGLKGEDALTTLPTIAYADEEIDTNEVGTYDIVVSGAAFSEDLAELYEIEYVNGELEIVKLPLIPVIPTYQVTVPEEVEGAQVIISNTEPKEGEDVTILVTAAPLYDLVDVIINGVSYGPATQITLSALGDMDIVVVTTPSGNFTDDNPVIADDEADENPYVGYIHSYVDVLPRNWFYTNVTWAWNRNLLDNTYAFYPNISADRATIVEWIWRLEGRPMAYGAPFTDTKAMSAAWASANGIVNGYGNGKFGPDDLVTREQLAAILFRYAQFKGVNTSARASLDKFTDASSVSSWATEAMQWAVGVGMINGYTDGTVKPQGNATRAELTALLNRLSMWYGF